MIRTILTLALIATPTLAQEAGTVGGPGLAIKSAKILTCDDGRGVVDRGILLVKDGKIEAVGPARELTVPEGYELVDVGQRWLMPGMIDLHNHAGAVESLLVNDLNDVVFLANPGLRAWGATKPNHPRHMLALQAGITSALVIPGSGSNMGGWGVLLKTGHDRFEEMLIRNPGSLKIAQYGNPESWGPGVGKTFENFTLRSTIQRGLAYAAEWAEFEANGGEEPLFDPQWEIFRYLAKKETQVSTHTQDYQVVLATLSILRKEMGLEVFIDHGSIGAWRAGKLADDAGVPAIVGPRNVDVPVRGFINWGKLSHEGFRGLAAGYQEMGHRQIGFNTDSPVIPQQELPVQATMAARLGFKDLNLDTVRGLTSVPAKTAGIDHRVGSLQVGRDADILVITGHPADTRSAIDRVWIDGETVYDSTQELRQW